MSARSRTSERCSRAQIWRTSSPTSSGSSRVFEGGFGPVIAFAEKHSQQLQSLSFFVLIFILVAVIVLMHVTDRLTFLVGFLLPPAFDFDIPTYEKHDPSFRAANAVLLSRRWERLMGSPAA